MEPVTSRRWTRRGSEPSPEAVSRLAASLGLRPLTAHLLLLRGIADADAGREFLDARLASLPDPLLLSGMERAAGRLAEALRRGERIAVHGDYDVDGITGTALLAENLRAWGGLVDCHIPLRLRDGYGLSAEALQRAASNGARVAVSVDCGVSALEEAHLAATLGLDLIITDHHTPPAQLPAAYALVNPQQPGCRYPDKTLAGVGVAFLLLVALRRVLREAGYFTGGEEQDLRRSLDLVALGTIADVVPLTGVNRLLARAGLDIINRRLRPGLVALLDVAGVRQANCGNVAFGLAPRLNAAGRLEDAAIGVDLLLTADAGTAKALAERLDGFNRDRQHLEQVTLQQAIERLEYNGEGGEGSIVLADSRWHPGVIGIVASRLVERYHRPTVLIALDGCAGKGSARSVDGIHLYRMLAGCASYLQGYGGHAMAAGLSIEEEQVPAFAAAFERQVLEAAASSDALPRRWHDGEIQLEELDRSVVEELVQLAPFGAGNPEPAFLLRQVHVQQPRVIGEKHLRFTARQGGHSHPAIAFGMAERLSQLPSTLDLLVTPQLNQWRNVTEVQLRVRDLRPTESLD